MHSPATLAYFCAPPGHYWEWDADVNAGNQAAVWPEDRGTIALRAELQELLEALQPEGLPPLGAVLLLMAAASSTWDSVAVRNRIWDAAQRATGNEEVPSGVLTKWRHVGYGLDQIHRLPEDLRTSPGARRALVRVVFERAFNRLPAALSREILTEFQETAYLEVFQQRTPELNGIARLLRDLSVLDKAVTNLPMDWLENRLRTGIDEPLSERVDLPDPEPDTTPLPEAPEDLLAALEREGGELAQVAGVVRRMLAILHVPKPVASADELPLGGVSDITNRGDPGRLLMTELAWDDTTFAVRLAQGEALYTRRESPPAEPPPRRVILLDTGIFLWGKPRVFALGVALALLRQKGREHAEGRVLTLEGAQFVPAPLATVEDVRRQLARLEPRPNPGPALNFWLEQETLAASQTTEVFLVTHPAALEAVIQGGGWQSLAGQAPLHSATVNREGQFTLARHSLAGARTLSQARLDLDHLLGGGGPGRAKAAALTDAAGLLPVFYQQKPWPLYVAAPPEPRKVFDIGAPGWVGVSTANTICWWRRPLCVGRVLHPDPPPGDLVAAAIDPEVHQLIYLVFRSAEEKELYLLPVWLHGRETLTPLRLNARLSELRGVVLQSQALVVHQLNIVQAFSLSDGRVIASTRPARTVQEGPPWYDGEKFHPNGDAKTVAPLTAEVVAEVPRQAQKRQRLHEIAEVGFDYAGGGIVIRKEKGRIFGLTIHDDGGLEWVTRLTVQARVERLTPMTLPDWPGHGLSQAEFPDGRRIIHDPRGFLHVLDGGDSAEQMSVVLVKGHTAAWQRRGAHYGEPNLLWDERAGDVAELKSLAARLLRPVTASTNRRNAASSR
jgi:hypothetical protein